MSRSYHKSNTNIGVFVKDSDSNKSSKQLCNRKFRRKSNELLQKDCTTGNFDDHMNFNKTREVFNICDFNSDGLCRYVHTVNMPKDFIIKLKRK